jgi:hypothetical protein
VRAGPQASDERLEEIKGLAVKPKFICFNYGRVANSQKNLCHPMALVEK